MSEEFKEYMVIREIEETMDGLAYQVHQALQVREAIQIYVALQVGEAIQVYLAQQMREAPTDERCSPGLSGPAAVRCYSA